jgi:hypothetical protein
MPDTHSGNRNTGGPIWPGGASKQGPHRIGSFCTCPQLEAFSQELYLRPIIEKDHTKIGTLVHVGLAYRYAMMLQQKPDWLVYADGRTAIWTCGQDRPELREVALCIFDAYQAHWGQPLWAPVLVEHQFEIALEGEPYTARLDLLAWDYAEGGYVLVDHKSKGYIKRETGYEYRADRQMLTQLALARFYGYDIKRVIINAMTRPKPNKLGFYDLQNFNPKFARFPVPISAIAYGRLWEDTVWALRNMKAVRTAYPDPMNRPRVYESCIRVYGPCDFVSLCTEGPDKLVDFVRRD